jgi:hypothetical protein
VQQSCWSGVDNSYLRSHPGVFHYGQCTCAPIISGATSFDIVEHLPDKALELVAVYPIE